MKCVVCAGEVEVRGERWVCPHCGNTYSGNVTKGCVKEIFAFLVMDPKSGVEGFISYRAGVTMVMAVGTEVGWALRNAEELKAMARKAGSEAKLVKFSCREEIPI